jgi:preprotein translocase subunit Sss1
MPTPGNTIPDPLADQYEEYIEFQCPMCQTPVTDEDKSCPGCGAIFVSSENETPDPGLDAAELEVDYELDNEIDLTDLDEKALDAEIAAMEADLDSDLLPDDSDSDPFDLDLSYEEDLAEEEDVEQAFGTTVKVSAEDHAALVKMSKPTLMERLFQRTGLGLFIAGGIGTVMVILWDPINGNPINLGETQWRFLVLALSMFIVGFAIEMLHAYSLSISDDDLLQQGYIEG